MEKFKPYITQKYVVSKKLYDYIWNLTKDVSDSPDVSLTKERIKYHKFLAHLYACAQSRQKEDFNDGFTPVPYVLIEKEFGRNFDIKRLNKLIDFKKHFYNGKIKGKCREFRLKEEIFHNCLMYETSDILQTWKEMIDIKKYNIKTVNLMNGNRLRDTEQKTIITGKNNNRNTNLVKIPVLNNLKQAFTPCPFNPLEVYKLVKAQQKTYNKANKEYLNVKKANNLSQKYLAKKRHAFGVFNNDFNALKTILYQKPRYVNKINKTHIFEYTAAYRFQISGRLTEIGGGFQNASQPFKELFFKKIPNIYNYDLSASQAKVLMQEFKATNISCDWLEKYLNNPKGKHIYAKKLNVDVDVWKTCFYALFFGAEIENYGGTVSNTLIHYFNGNYQKAKSTIDQFIKLTEDLYLKTKRWRRLLCFRNHPRYSYPYGNYIYWKNALGLRFKQFGIMKNSNQLVLDGKPTTNKREIKACQRTLSAFILQGQEACFIHHLTNLCNQNDIPVYKNEHDGLITGKTIPKKLINQAANISGLIKPVFLKKDLCSEEKREKMKSFLKNRKLL
ncbi:hypothetical protein MTBBW1_2470007 [Desulfamplus magnetovallimortis]|uniref:DNA-directed DNA polymerase family A palm domain-containing protein n=1 Tax=Desulfamplus magnetovallimortis TaxID=1246637 RepID=A0A1W1HEC8_9BACT|nr:hypothetical protein [Desulfamplus magnetovallimortis]SLM30820.1 hypothetical protein MTBBW1_2470007 [Desulfamplus magnetovallimortis]